MDAYEKELIARAVEASVRNHEALKIERLRTEWCVRLDGDGSEHYHDDGLAVALIGLLAYFGEAVPPRPSAEELLDLEHDFRAYGGTDDARDHLRREQSSEPLLVSTWLEGGEA